MKLVIFGLTISSSWGNGHATLWRGLCPRAGARGHHVVFFERDVPYYAIHRDLRDSRAATPSTSWDDVRAARRAPPGDADVAMVTSYCPDARGVASWCSGRRLRWRLLRSRYAGHAQPLAPARPCSISAEGLGDFDLVLSYTGGGALDALRASSAPAAWRRCMAASIRDVHRPPPSPAFDARPLVSRHVRRRPAAGARAPLRRAGAAAPDLRFVIGGSQYPRISLDAEHLLRPPLAARDHPGFFCSSRLTLNVTRAAMAAMGHCPSGRLFEAAACGAPILSDWWEGLDAFFEPGAEILVAETTEEALAAAAMRRRDARVAARRANERSRTTRPSAARAIWSARSTRRAHAGRSNCPEALTMWGIIPAAGSGSRIQPLAFSKELLPIGSRFDGGVERPRAVTEYLIERMIPRRRHTDLLRHRAGQVRHPGVLRRRRSARPRLLRRAAAAAGLCDAIFRARRDRPDERS